jgi:hypothetical protein
MASDVGCPTSPSAKPRRKWRWRRLALGAIVGLAVYAAYEYPSGTLHAVGQNEFREIFGAERVTMWESAHGRAQVLRVTFASHMRTFADTTTMWHEARILGPFAESLAARTGDTIIQLDHRRYPISRMLPVRIDVWTYYHREQQGVWALSTNLWH